MNSDKNPKNNSQNSLSIKSDIKKFKNNPGNPDFIIS